MRVSDSKQRLDGWIWRDDLDALDARRRWLVFLLRLSWLIARDVTEGLLTLRAMSLVYTTLMSLVPLLAVSFSVLKAFGVQRQLEVTLSNFLAPMGEQGVEITQRITGFVANVNAGVLGTVGLAFLFYTVISLMQKIERAFNVAWRIEEARSFARRFSDYLTIVLVGPVLVVAALGITGSMLQSDVAQQLVGMQPFGAAIGLAGRLVPYLLIIAAFMLIYMLVPNTRVRMGPALAGAVVAGVLWQTAGWAFGAFVVNSAKYTAIYSAFASLVMFMIWVYVAWLVLLIGASVAYYVQHPERMLGDASEESPSIEAQEQLAVSIMLLIGRSMYGGEPPVAAPALARRLRAGVEPVIRTIGVLERRGLLRASADEPPCYLPTRPLDALEVVEVLGAVRSFGEGARPGVSTRAADDAAVRRFFASREAAAAAVTRGVTIKTLIGDDGAPGSAADPADAQASASTRPEKGSSAVPQVIAGRSG
jgi:membrane protein